MTRLFLLIGSLIPALAWAATSTTPTTVEAVAGTWRAQTTAFARVSARQQGRLSLPFDAIITSVAIEPGTRVAQGQVLLRFDAPLLRRHLGAWDSARESLDLARERLRVLREARKQHARTRQEVIGAEQALLAAQDRLDQDWTRLASDLQALHLSKDAQALTRAIRDQGLAVTAQALSRVQAPFAGFVGELGVTRGTEIRAAAVVLELENLDRVALDAGIAPAQLPAWRGGQTYWSDHNETGPLIVPEGEPARFDAASGLWQRRFIADNVPARLQDGAWVQVVHQGPPQAVVWVPATAVVARDAKTWCMTLSAGHVKAQPVRVGTAVDGRVPVLQGLSAGTAVVSEGAYELLYSDLKSLIQFED